MEQVQSGRTINLAELARRIRSDRGMCELITDAARREFERPSLRLEDAIVLLGGQGLDALVSGHIAGPARSRGRRHTHINSRTPSANLRPLETLQGETK